MKIREETSNDWFEVENLTREAFWNVYRPGCTEHLIVHNFRSHPDFVKELSLVGVDEVSNRIIAHIMYCKTIIRLDSGEHKEILMFGPVSVTPDYQHRGLGSKLIVHSMGKAIKLGYKAIAIIGNPIFYHRFGFKSGSEFSLYYPGIPRTETAPFFMVIELVKGYLSTIVGSIIEPETYSASDEAVNEFDQQFPPKIKEIRPGQLG